ncbi:metallophosphoesterase [Bacillus sp. FJAT-47783]|uniref:metallophosphoesterase n=1 Tax=Bacillus sp. FJAT-47783 TaxID=2922712 RepID=UPI001FABB698|nr:metallophosphoesterase [Bacillus sp. FJAT-47783]
MNVFFIIFILTIFVLLIYKAYKNTKHVVINDVDLSKRETSNFHAPKLNILHISDMHLENISITPQQLYRKLKHEKIDLIALTGDFLDRKRSIPKLVPYLQSFHQLNPKYGMYAVFGNHDYVLRQKDFAVLKQTLEQYGCKAMQNEHDTIMVHGKRVNIIGVDDASTNRSDLSKSYKDLKEGYHLVLTHDPNLVLNMKEYHFDYLLSGHFHGGQIHWPKPYHLAKLGRKMMRLNMVKGLHYYDGKPFYISEGLGQTGVNIRVGSRPEITLHRLPLCTMANEETPTAV